MSNLSELITDLNESDHTSLNIFGAAVGTLADFSSGIGLAVDLNQLFNMIVSPDDSNKLQDDIRNAVNQGFAKLGLQLKADELLSQWDNIDNITRNAEGVYQTLKATLSSPHSPDYVLQQIQVCVTALNGLSFTAHSEQWSVSHTDQVYFSPINQSLYNAGGASSAVFTFAPGPADPDNTPQLGDAFSCQGMTFTNTFDPGADGNGLVFGYTYTLPAYLMLVVIFLATAVALDPDYTKPEKYADNIRSASSDLQALLIKIQSGIVNVAAPDADSMVMPFPFDRTSEAGFLEGGYNEQRASQRYDNTWWYAGWGTADTLIPELSQPYGAVNLYSGAYAIAGYPVLDIPIGVFPQSTATETTPPLPGTDFFIRPVSKYLLRSLARSKDVYVGIGLRVVWEVINRLNRLVGDPPLPRSFGDWSLREIFSVLGYPSNPFIKAQLSPQTHVLTLGVVDLAIYLAMSTPSFPVPPRPFSVRQLIDELPPGVPYNQ